MTCKAGFTTQVPSCHVRGMGLKVSTRFVKLIIEIQIEWDSYGQCF